MPPSSRNEDHDAFAAALSGSLVVPGDPDFEATARVFNQAFRHRPRLVVRCSTTDDVVAAVRHARAAGLPVTVRSGGHAHGGASVGEGAAVIDLRGLDTIEVDREAMTATLGGGVASGALIRQLAAEGLATVTGFDPRVGVSGLLLGGGYGLLSRRHGLACDQLLEAEVVLADGSVVVASPTQEPDLFWALRGAGANVGVVTKLVLRVHELPSVYGGTFAYHAGRAADLLPRYRAFLETLGDDTTVYVGLETAPNTFPSLTFMAFHLGPPDEGEAVLHPLTTWGRSLGGGFSEVDVVALHHDAENETFPEGFSHSWRSHFLSALDDAAIATLSGAVSDSVQRSSWTVLEHMGGAIGRVDPASTAFAHRGVQLGWVSALKWQGAPDPDALAWQEWFFEQMRPRALGSYVNYVSPKHGPEAVVAAYTSNLSRLQQLKARYDPEWVLTGNVTVPRPSQPPR